MGEFQSVGKITTNGSGAGSAFSGAKGTLALIDIVPKQSTSFDITISRVLPDDTLATIYTATGITALTSIGREDMIPLSVELAGQIKVVLANAGNNHTDACRVYLTVV